MTAWTVFLFAVRNAVKTVKNVSPHHILHKRSGIVCLNWPRRHITKAERGFFICSHAEWTVLESGLKWAHRRISGYCAGVLLGRLWIHLGFISELFWFPGADKTPDIIPQRETEGVRMMRFQAWKVIAALSCDNSLPTGSTREVFKCRRQCLALSHLPSAFLSLPGCTLQ